MNKPTVGAIIVIVDLIFFGWLGWQAFVWMAQYVATMTLKGDE